MTETYGYDKTPTPPRDYDINKVPSEIRKRTEWVKSKFTGEDVAEAYRQAGDIAGIYAGEAKRIAEQTQYRQDAVETDFDALQRSNTEEAYWGAEIVVASDGEPTLDKRLDRDFNGIQFRLDDNAISPDDFLGNDLQKIQQAIDYALEHNGGVKFSRIYDITSLGSILINKNHNERNKTLVLYGFGGGIEKNDGGYIFNTTFALSGDISLLSMTFKSVVGSGVVVWNEKIIRVSEVSSIYRNIDHYFNSTNKYMQTYDLVNVSVVGGQDSFIKTPAAFDVGFLGGFIEHRDNFFEQVPFEQGAQFTRLQNVTFRDLMIEGLTGFTYKFRNLQNVTIDGAYYEQNQEDIIIMNNSDVMSLNIKNIISLNGYSEAFLKFGAAYPRYIKLENVYTYNQAVVDVTDVQGSSRIILDNCSTNSNHAEVIGDATRVINISSRNFGGNDTTGYYTDIGWAKRILKTKSVSVPPNSFESYFVELPLITNRRDVLYSVKLQPQDGLNKKMIIANFNHSTDGTGLNIMIKSEEGYTFPVTVIVVALVMHVSPG